MEYFNFPPCLPALRGPGLQSRCDPVTMSQPEETACPASKCCYQNFKDTRKVLLTVSADDDDLSITVQHGFLLARGGNAWGTLMAMFTRNSLANTLRDEGYCHLTSMPHASPQAPSLRPVNVLTPEHKNRHCYLSCDQLASRSL